MGLEQCLYRTHKNVTEEIITKFYIRFCRREITTIQFERVVEPLEYWNKNYELEQLIYEIWKKRKNEDDDIEKFNCKFVLLTEENINSIISKVDNEKIKKVMGEILKESENKNIFFYSSW